MQNHIGSCSEMARLIGILRCRLQGKRFARPLSREVGLAKLLELARRHGVSWLLCDAMAAEYDQTVPEYALLQREIRAISIQALKKCADLHKIADLCKAENIKAVFYKGAALSAMIHGNVAARSYRDTDLLVETYEEALRLRDILMAEGFIASEKLPAGWQTFKKGYHIEFQLQSPAGAGVDIHWKLFHDYYVPEYLFAGLFYDEKNFCRVRVAGREVSTLAPDMHLLVLCLHHATHCWNELRLIADIAGIINRYQEIDYAELFGKARSHGVCRMLCVGLRLAVNLGAKLPEAARRELEKDRLSRSLAWLVWRRIGTGHTAVAKGEIMLFETAARDSWRRRLRFLIKAAFQPSDNDLRFITLPAGWFAAYFLLRPIRQLMEIGRLCWFSAAKKIDR